MVTLALSAFVVPEQLYPWLTLVSGLLVVGRRRLGAAQPRSDTGAPTRTAITTITTTTTTTLRGLLGVGIAAGLLPCPSALVVLLSAIALHRIGLGLALILAFSVGLAATITGIGLVAVLARRAFGRLRLDGPLVRTLPAVSARARFSRSASALPSTHFRRCSSMFGLDDWLASYSDGASLAVVALVAIALGLRHATDPDHLAAVERAARVRARAGRPAGRAARRSPGASATR